MKTIKTNADSFESDVQNSTLPVLVDFYAEWCGPCKSIAPALEEMAAAFDGKCVIAKVDVDESRELAMQYGVRSVPSFVIFKDGEVVDMKTGASSKGELEGFLSSVL